MFSLSKLFSAEISLKLELKIPEFSNFEFLFYDPLLLGILILF